MNIYVGNLSQQVGEEDLRTIFEAFGNVSSVKLIRDKFSGVSKGFGFVEMETKPEAEAAIQGLNQTELQGTHITVNEARPRPDNRKGGRRR